jgi:hypothetical protein
MVNIILFDGSNGAASGNTMLLNSSTTIVLFTNLAKTIYLLTAIYRTTLDVYMAT